MSKSITGYVVQRDGDNFAIYRSRFLADEHGHAVWDIVRDEATIVWGNAELSSVDCYGDRYVYRTLGEAAAAVAPDLARHKQFARIKADHLEELANSLHLLVYGGAK